jgi:hypothetical protein
MRRSDTTGTSAEVPSENREQLFRAFHDLVMDGHASLHSISDDDYWLRLATGEAFTLGQHGVLRIV